MKFTPKVCSNELVFDLGPKSSIFPHERDSIDATGA